MKLYFLLVRRVQGVMSPVLVEAWDILTRRGFEVEYGIAEEMVTRPGHVRVGHDLYVLKSRTELSLSLAGVLHAQGARFLNPYECCVSTQNKIVSARRLQRAGVPTPRTWVTGDFGLLEELVDDMPLVLKPYRGHRGAGIHVVHDRAELQAVPMTDDPMLVQEYVAGTGEDVKIYVVGEQVFAVRKEFSENSFAQPGRPSAVSEELRDIALRCGHALGLGLYGLDVIESPGGPVVVDLNYFPGYKGVPQIAPLIADYIEGYALGRHTLALPDLAPETSSEGEPQAPRPPASRGRPRRRGQGAEPPDPKPVKRRRARVNPSLTAIVVEGMLSRLAFGLISFALPLYAYRELGMSLTQVGLLASFNSMVAIGLKPMMGSLADRFGLKRGLQTAIGLRSLVSLLLAFAAFPWQLFAIRGLHGVSISMRDPSVHALIAEHGGKKAIASVVRVVPDREEPRRRGREAPCRTPSGPHRLELLTGLPDRLCDIGAAVLRRVAIPARAGARRGGARGCGCLRRGRDGGRRDACLPEQLRACGAAVTRRRVGDATLSRLGHQSFGSWGSASSSAPPPACSRTSSRSSPWSTPA